MEPAMQKQKVTYMLRRTLCAWKTEALIAETVDYCRRAAVDEIMWISESSGRYRELLPLPQIEKLVQTKTRKQSLSMEKGKS